MTEKKCPRCGGEPSRKQKHDGVSWDELPFEKQECVGCGMPCKFWKEWSQLLRHAMPPSLAIRSPEPGMKVPPPPPPPPSW